MNFCYIRYIIVINEKYKHHLLNLLHLKVTNIYTYNFNLYKKNSLKNLYKIFFVICTQNLYKISFIIDMR